MGDIPQAAPARNIKSDRVLYGVRAIARHLGVSDVTVHRLREKGLPVQRAKNGKLNTTVADLNEWLKGGRQ